MHVFWMLTNPCPKAVDVCMKKIDRHLMILIYHPFVNHGRSATYLIFIIIRIRGSYLIRNRCFISLHFRFVWLDIRSIDCLFSSFVDRINFFCHFDFHGQQLFKFVVVNLKFVLCILSLNEKDKTNNFSRSNLFAISSLQSIKFVGAASGQLARFWNSFKFFFYGLIVIVTYVSCSSTSLSLKFLLLNNCALIIYLQSPRAYQKQLFKNWGKTLNTDSYTYIYYYECV